MSVQRNVRLNARAVAAASLALLADTRWRWLLAFEVGDSRAGLSLTNSLNACQFFRIRDLYTSSSLWQHDI